MVKSLDIIDPKKDLEEEPKDTRKSEYEDLRMEKSDKGGGSGVFYLVLGIIAIVVATAAALYILYKDYLPNKNTQVTPTADVSATKTASTSATTSTTPTSLTSLTPTTSAFQYTNEQIRIANGNGISGEAAKVENLLVSMGFKVASTGNASKKYSQTIIYYKTGQEGLATALKGAISTLYQSTTEQSDATVGKYDAVIALGSK